MLCGPLSSLTRHVLLVQPPEQAGGVHIKVLHSSVGGAGAPGGAEAWGGARAAAGQWGWRSAVKLE